MFDFYVMIFIFIIWFLYTISIIINDMKSEEKDEI